MVNVTFKVNLVEFCSTLQLYRVFTPIQCHAMTHRFLSFYRICRSQALHTSCAKQRQVPAESWKKHGSAFPVIKSLILVDSIRSAVFSSSALAPSHSQFQCPHLAGFPRFKIQLWRLLKEHLRNCSSHSCSFSWRCKSLPLLCLPGSLSTVT